MRTYFEGYNIDAMKNCSHVINVEYGEPYDDCWEYIADMGEKHNLDMTIRDNVVWCMLEVEKEFREKYGRPYYWK